MVSQDFEDAYKEANNLKNASQDDMLEVCATRAPGDVITDKAKSSMP